MTTSRRPLILLLLVLLAYACLLFSERRRQESLNTHQQEGGLHRRKLWGRDTLGHFHRLFTEKEAGENALEINEWRQKFDINCGMFNTTEEHITSLLRKAFKPSRIKKGTHEDSLPIETCQYTVLDLGSSIGNTLGKLIDAGLPTCRSKGMNPSRYEMSSGLVGVTFYGARPNPLVAWLSSILKSVNRFPESYCFFGMEGNPLFTDQLTQLERQVMRSHPRPVRRAHFMTSSVITRIDGPNTKSWGSSLRAPTRHQDAAETSGKTINGTVDGFTLSTLLEHTVKYESGSHVIIKMDVEGAEYQIFQESIPTLCNFTKAGVQIDLLIAIHDADVLVDESSSSSSTTTTTTASQIDAIMDAYATNKIKALECGINLYEGDYGQ